MRNMNRSNESYINVHLGKVFKQKPVDEDIASTYPPEEDQIGGVVEEGDGVARQPIGPVKQTAYDMMFDDAAPAEDQASRDCKEKPHGQWNTDRQGRRCYQLTRVSGE